MSITKKIEYLWTAAYERALGAGHPAPFDYADAQVAHLSATLRAVERKQARPNGHLRVGCRAFRGRAA